MTDLALSFTISYRPITIISGKFVLSSGKIMLFKSS